MKERPILFSGPMVRALLAGQKTQTRRLIKPQPVLSDEHAAIANEAWQSGFVDVKCPYGVYRDRLWVKETWALRGWHMCGTVAQIAYRADWEHGGRMAEVDVSSVPASALPMADVDKWKPSIFMSRWASRITLEITEVRVERLQEITTEDAFAEGIQAYEGCTSNHDMEGWDPIVHFSKLWDSINGDRAPWESNPWVWVVTFRRLQP